MLQPDMPPFSAAGEAPSPVSSRPPPPQQQQQMEELGAGGSGRLEQEGGVGGEEGGSSAGNRWPRQETLALLKIRSEMDAAFREAALKGPLWDQVSRRMAEMGYTRSAKKCREKFENVDKYYKRTKDGRAGRGDGKAYRFFSELEALHGAAHRPPPPQLSLAPTPVAVAPPAPRMPVLQPAVQAARAAEAPCAVTVGDGSFSVGSEAWSDGEDTEETAEGGKRKRRDGEAMRLFEGMMRQVLERQEAMQWRLIEAMERRDQERMAREEAWRRQEVARLAREQDALAKERAFTASRDAALISFIQRVTGQTLPLPPIAAPPPASPASIMPRPLQPMPVASAAPPPPQHQHQQTPPPAQPQKTTSHSHIMPLTPQPQPPHAQSKADEVVVRAPESQETGGGGAPLASTSPSPSPSRWPKAEVHALIQMRTELETRYQEAGPKGPLWEDISAGMRRLGYNRSAKRCKEKWENINKYFKKVKERNKKRPEDSKTCPYYHQLEALYRSKALAAAARPEALAAVPLSQTGPAPHINGNGNGCAATASRDNGGSSGGMQIMKTGNGSVAAGAGGNGVATTNKQLQGLKQEGAAAKETAAAEHRQQPVAMKSSYGDERMEEMDSGSMEEDDDEFDDEVDDYDDEDAGGGEQMHMQVQYDIHYQRQQQPQHNGGQSVVRPNTTGSGNPPATTPAAPQGTSAASFLAMVQ